MIVDDFNFRHLRAVTAIMQIGTVNSAARAIGVTQPAITQGVAKLEALLGVKLFERSSAGMFPTTAGRLFGLRCARAIALIGSSRITAPQARSLIALARYGSYAAAANALQVREPSLHRAITDLSVSLQQQIVERRGRGVALTRRGLELARRFRLARAELESGVEEVQRLLGQEVGRVVLGAMPLSRAKLLPEVIGQFRRVHPKVEVAVVEGSHLELISPLRNGEIDFLVGALRSELPPDLAHSKLFVDRPIVIGRIDHPLALKSEAVTIPELASFPWIVPGSDTPLRLQWSGMFQLSGQEPPRVAIECGSVLLIRQLLMQGDYLTLLSPTQVAVELEARWLVKICAAPGNPSRTIGVTARAEWRPTKVQEFFLELLEREAKLLQTLDD